MSTKYPGKTKTRLYSIWEGLIQRCCNPLNKDYYKYGAIGRDLCDSWKDSDIFFDWAYSHGYSDDISLDRIDNTKGYSPENCRFADRRTQNTNKVNNRIVTYKDFTGTVVELCEKFNLVEKRIRTRLANGFTIEEAVELPKNARASVKVPFQSHIRSFDKETKERIVYEY